jgi:adenosylcobinamide kinase/adenosylcobinamide-phosphate guanylyltransferase
VKAVKRIVLITGGARSGKSDFALRWADRLGGRRVFLATAQALDREMERRIAQHRQARGEGWETIEEPYALSEAIREAAATYDTVLVDCLTLWTSNLLLRGGAEALSSGVESLARTLGQGLSAHVLMVTNELGSGIVPENALAREFRDRIGQANQRLARVCTDVVLVVCGHPLALRRDGTPTWRPPWTSGEETG